MKYEKFFFHGILVGRYEEEQLGVMLNSERFFRGFSTFKYSKTESFEGTIAKVPKSEIQELDMIEGVPSFYIRFKKEILNVETGKEEMCWVYQQAEDRINDLAM